MLRALASVASRWVNDLSRSLLRERLPSAEILEAPSVPRRPRSYQRLERVVLTDAVGRTLFDEYAAHRQSARGDDETGWVLLGVREENEALVLATLPAGAASSAGVAHIRFNSYAQALASRIVRQWDQRLSIIGVVHTHPGSLRHPSDGDYRGDALWVGQLRGREGVFGIGTADGVPQRSPSERGERMTTGGGVARQPHKNVQSLGELSFCWYALGEGERRYRPLQVQLTLGPDLAKPLHPAWETIEIHAERLDRLARQQAGVVFQVVEGQSGPALAVHMTLAERGRLRLVLERNDVRYYLVRQDDLIEVSPKEKLVDRAVYLVLAELAGQ
jgi:proteasome lid subunit RPN8/RPN11